MESGFRDKVEITILTLQDECAFSFEGRFIFQNGKTFCKGEEVMKKIFFAVVCFCMMGALLMSGPGVPQLKAGDGAMIVQNRCTVCHGTGRIERAGHDWDGWKSTVNRMMGKPNFGPELSDAELKALLDHLASL